MHSKGYLLLFLMIIGAISTLIAGFFLFAQQNEYTLAQAIERNQVTVEIRGIAEDGRFLQPMLDMTLTKNSFWPLTVIIPQGSLLSTSSASSDVVTLQEQKMTLLSRQQDTKILAYSLDYHKSFPDSQSEYQLSAKMAKNNQKLRGVLNNIEGLQAEPEIASQMAVWLISQEVEFEEIEHALGLDLSQHRERVDQIVESEFDSVAAGSASWWLTAISICVALLTWCFSMFFLWQRRKSNPRQKRPIQVKGLIHQLTDWQLLNKGEISEIWSAFDKRAGKSEQVVVKFPRSHSSGISQRNIHYRFEKGIEHLQQMTHQHIAQLIESGECLHPRDGQQTLYLIQEFVDGSTLDEILQERNYQSLDTLSIMQIVGQLSHALKEIHQKQLVYRNMSLNNIMVDKKGQVYLTDFANTTLLDSSETGDIGLSPIGTSPFYAPPDLIGNVPARDYYSLAMLIMAMYVGKPITGLTWQEVKHDLEDLYQNLKGVPKSVPAVLEWCLNVGNHKMSAEVRHDFSTPRQLLATMVEETKNQ